jgi:hypothetical protein
MEKRKAILAQFGIDCANDGPIPLYLMTNMNLDIMSLGGPGCFFG